MDLDIAQALQSSLERVSGWIEGAVRALPSLVAALLVFALFWFAAKTVRRLVRRLLDQVSDYRAVNRLVSTLVFCAAVVLGLLVALGILDLDRTVTSILAGAGILGLAVGFAAQDMVSNLMAGILLSVRRPLKPGELISSGDTFGTVEEINLRATVVRTPGGQLVYVPNSDILTNPLTNYTTLGRRRVDVVCGVSYADDLEKAKRVTLEALAGVEGRDESRDVEFFYDEFGGSSINFKARFWVPFEASNGPYLAARSDAI
ncbi:MAG: mechanosensitive ion channel, partial [Gemmatimonadota bacterium]|nr:mechanosensitive ion channel [Gemmatimonadota bacterium]